MFYIAAMMIAAAATAATATNIICDDTSQYRDEILNKCSSCAEDCHESRLTNNAAINECKLKCAGWYTERQRVNTLVANLANKGLFSHNINCNNYIQSTILPNNTINGICIQSPSAIFNNTVLKPGSYMASISIYSTLHENDTWGYNVFYGNVHWATCMTHGPQCSITVFIHANIANKINIKPLTRIKINRHKEYSVIYINKI